ncbi:MAG: hypothetical protein G01um101416_837 [Microgenomates group bacterium Gr01-1014_16]|nr:MAG: hypothetical protein G01um101416_837 [Microgenomates group bacterium Gr01-1014_16]
MIQLHLESLDEHRRKVFEKLGSFRSQGVLAGGTAIALQIGHRRSFDFDIFTSSSLTPSLWAKAKKVFGKGVLKTLSTENQLNFVTSENVSITFFYDEVEPLRLEVPTSSISLLDLRDLAGNKAFTIGQRGKWRDYVDLYFLLKTNSVTLEQIIDNCSQRSREEIFPTKLFLEQLVYYDDLTIQEIDFIGSKIEPLEIKRFLSEQVKKFKDSELG